MGVRNPYTRGSALISSGSRNSWEYEKVPYIIVYILHYTHTQEVEGTDNTKASNVKPFIYTHDPVVVAYVGSLVSR